MFEVLLASLFVGLTVDPLILLSFKGILLIVVLDAVLGMAGAIWLGTFDIRLAPKFIKTNSIYIIIPGILLLATIAEPSYNIIYWTVAGLVTAKFGTEALKDKISIFFQVKEAA